MSIDDNFRPYVRLERRDCVRRHSESHEDSWVFVGLDPDKNARFELLFLSPAPQKLRGQGSAAAAIGTRNISIVAGQAALDENKDVLANAQLNARFRVDLTIDVDAGVGKVTSLKLIDDCKRHK